MRKLTLGANFINEENFFLYIFPEMKDGCRYMLHYFTG